MWTIKEEILFIIIIDDFCLSWVESSILEDEFWVNGGMNINEFK